MNPSPYQNSADYSRIQSLHIHLMSAYYVSHTISDDGDTAANKREKVCVLKKLIPMQVFLPIRRLTPFPELRCLLPFSYVHHCLAVHAPFVFLPLSSRWSSPPPSHAPRLPRALPPEALVESVGLSS